MNFHHKETISFTEEEENTISDMHNLLVDISGNCDDDGLRESAIEIINLIEKFIQDYREEEE